MWIRMPAKQDAGAAVTLLTVHGAPAAPNAAKPWSNVICPAGMDPFASLPNWPTKSTLHGALVARRLNSPVTSWIMERMNAARTTVFCPHLPPEVQAKTTRGQKFDMPYNWMYSARQFHYQP